MSGPSLERLRERLVRAGVSPRYARGLISELSDHWRGTFDALVTEGCSPDEAGRVAHQRLGSDEDLVDCVLATKRFRSFGRRAPFLVFVLVPVLFMPVVSVVITLLTVSAIFTLWSEFGVFTREHATYLFLGTFVGMVPAIFGIAAICAVLYARSRRCSLLWPLMTASLLACIALVLRFDYAHGTIAVGIATSGASRALLPLISLLIVASIWFAHRHFRAFTQRAAVH